MTVNYQAKQAKDIFPVDGVQIYVGQAGIKKEEHNDLTLMVLSPSSKVSAVFTQNSFCAAPVTIARNHLALQQGVRALVINTGNANAGTGKTGLCHAEEICQAVAVQIHCQSEQVLPFSTGVIQEPLPHSKIILALPKVKPVHWDIAAEAIMTTDTQPKTASIKQEIDGEIVTFTGMAKGSGMICPNMATMLGFIATDIDIAADVLDILVKEVADETFNCITVDGDTSTNDSFVLIATSKSKLPQVVDIQSAHYQQIKKAFTLVALELAQAIIRDGEGATKFITIHVKSGESKEECRQVAYAIAHSPLVKTAFYASDANLGRIICAIGNAGIQDLNIEQVRLFLDNILVIEDGGRALLYKEEDGQRIMGQDEITIRVELARGDAEATVYTCDFSHEYININSSYRS